MQNDLVVQGTVAETVTTILKEALSARGIAVKDVAGWDLTPKACMPKERTFCSAARSRRFGWNPRPSFACNTHVKAAVQLKITVGDTVAKEDHQDPGREQQD